MLKYVNTSVVFQEIPDEVTLMVNISNCPCRCPGCHSRYLWEDEGEELNPETMDKLLRHYGKGVTCLCFMGGDAHPEWVDHLARKLHRDYPHLKVGWYSGRTTISNAIRKDDFDYIKVGPYIAHLGSLKERTTNQRLYKRLPTGEWTDITHRFWKKAVSETLSRQAIPEEVSTLTRTRQEVLTQAKQPETSVPQTAR